MPSSFLTYHFPHVLHARQACSGRLLGICSLRFSLSLMAAGFSVLSSAPSDVYSPSLGVFFLRWVCGLRFPRLSSLVHSSRAWLCTMAGKTNSFVTHARTRQREPPVAEEALHQQKEGRKVCSPASFMRLQQTTADATVRASVCVSVPVVSGVKSFKVVSIPGAESSTTFLRIGRRARHAWSDCSGTYTHVHSS